MYAGCERGRQHQACDICSAAGHCELYMYMYLLLYMLECVTQDLARYFL